MSKTLRIGTRGSALALWQAHAVVDAIEQAFSDMQCEIVVFKTQGDINLSSPLSEIGDKGLFTKELEVALLQGDVDACVHSMKDMLTELPAGCALGAMLPRADARDALVCGPRVQADALDKLPEGTRLATGSIRRSAFLRAQHMHVEPKGVRGNVETRLKKAQGNEYEGAILAVAGLERLGLSEHISAYIPIEDMIPAAGQGAVGIEIREDDADMRAICDAIGCKITQACVEAERMIMGALEAGCHVPLGVHARVYNDGWRIDAAVLSPDTRHQARTMREVTDSNDTRDLLDMARIVLHELDKQGAREILREARESDNHE